jgi:hypothetical protein
MHQECNVAESIMSMCLDVISFIKDSVNARKDLAALCDRPSLEAKPNARGNLKWSKAPYCLKPTERKEVLRWLKTLKLPNRYAVNIKRVVNVGTGKLSGLKSHDYHIFIERLMSVMFRSHFNPDLWKMFTELSCFYRQICVKQVSMDWTRSWGPFAGCCTLAWLSWAADDRLQAHGPTGRWSRTPTRTAVRTAWCICSR